jgi:flagellar biosynthetic protein FliO
VDSISFFWSFFKMLAALTIVIGLMIVALHAMKKYFMQSPSPMDGNALIRIVTTCHLSPKNSIMLVEVLGQVMLVGVSNQQMSLLTTINDPGAMEKISKVRPQEGKFTTPDPLARVKSILLNLKHRQKDR